MITKGQSDCWNTSVTKCCLFAVSLKFPYEHSIMLCKTLTSQYLFKQETVIGFVGAAFKQGFVYFNMLFLVIYGIIGILIYQIIKLNSWYFCSKVHKCHSPSLTQICLWVIIKEFKVRLKVMMPFEELSASKKVLQQVIYLKSSELKFLLKKKFSFKVKKETRWRCHLVLFVKLRSLTRQKTHLHKRFATLFLSCVFCSDMWTAVFTLG